jgi:putative DNA primase/helicase
VRQQFESARDIANGKWSGILGKWLDERALSGKHTACPLCGGKDRWRFDDKGGNGTWICNRCGAGDGLHLLMHLGGMEFKEAAAYVGQMAGKVKKMNPAPDVDPEETRSSLRRIWEGASPVAEGDPVSKYLGARCGSLGVGLHSIRFHPALTYKHDDGTSTRHPAMLARVVGHDNAPLTIHRTYLTSEGGKAAVPTVKKLMRPIYHLDNVSIRLGRPLDGWLGVAEGIETALCAAERFGVTVWACVSAGLLETFRPPAGVKMLSIFADNDRSFVGQASAYRLAQKVSALGVECKVLIPSSEGDDWADEFARSK